METKSYTYHQHRDIKLARKRLLSKQEDKNMTVNGVQNSESSQEHSLVDQRARRKPLASDMGPCRQRFQPPSIFLDTSKHNIQTKPCIL